MPFRNTLKRCQTHEKEVNHETTPPYLRDQFTTCDHIWIDLKETLTYESYTMVVNNTTLSYLWVSISKLQGDATSPSRPCYKENKNKKKNKQTKNKNKQTNKQKQTGSLGLNNMVHIFIW